MVALYTFQFFNVCWHPYYGIELRDQNIQDDIDNPSNVWLPGNPVFVVVAM